VLVRVLVRRHWMENLLNHTIQGSDNSPRINRNTGYENQRIGNVAGARENVDAADSRPIFDDEPLQKVSNDDYYNVFAIEMIRLEKERRSKLINLIRPFDYDKLNNLYDLFVPQREKSSEQRYFSERSRLSHINVNNGKSKESFNKQTTLLEKRMDEFIPLDKQCQSSLEIFKVKSISAGLHQFHRCLNEEMVADLRYFNSLESEVDSLRSQLETQKTQFLNKIDRLSREYYYADHMNAILGVIPTTSVSRPQLKSNPQGDRVMQNNSQGKKQEVKDHRRSVKLSKNKTSVTACNDSLNAKTLNVESVLTMCDKCVLVDKHDMCVLKTVAKPLKETVASESNKKPRNFTRKLYERVSKTCSWWYPKFTPSGYKWKPKFGKENVNSNVSMPLGNAYRLANVMDTMTSRCSTVSNTTLSSNSLLARRDCPIHRRLWVLKAHDGKSQASN
nr:hypothetical protein [Tanacetum cinerariifolium]